MAPVKYSSQFEIFSMKILIGSKFIEATLSRGHLFSAILSYTQNKHYLCIANASSSFVTASSVLECVFYNKDATYLNVIDNGPDGNNVTCERYNGLDPPLHALKGCRAFQVCSALSASVTFLE